VLDYDVVDERLVCEGFLNEYKYLIWPTGTITEESTLDRIAEWVENGGTLLVCEIEKIGTIEGKSNNFTKIANLVAENGVRKAGKGCSIQISKDIADLCSKYPGKLDDLDDVLLSEFKDGILVFNRGKDSVAKKISTSNGSVELMLESCQMAWIDK
jgi:hypothetical protein